MTGATHQRVAETPRRIGVGDPARPAVGWPEIGIGVGSYLVLSVLLIFGVAFAFGGTVPAVPAVAASSVAALAAAVVAISVRVRSRNALGLRRMSWRWVGIGIGAGVGSACSAGWSSSATSL